MKLRKIKEQYNHSPIKSTVFVDRQNLAQGQRFILHEDGEIRIFGFKNGRHIGIKVQIL